MRRSTLFASIPLGLLAVAFLFVSNRTEIRAEPGSLPVDKSGDGKLKYNRDVRPILAENCFACHGPDVAKRKAGLRLDTKEGAFGKGDRKSVV